VIKEANERAEIPAVKQAEIGESEPKDLKTPIAGRSSGWKSDRTRTGGKVIAPGVK
jgi:hypothetical protein